MKSQEGTGLQQSTKISNPTQTASIETCRGLAGGLPSCVMHCHIDPIPVDHLFPTIEMVACFGKPLFVESFLQYGLVWRLRDNK